MISYTAAGLELAPLIRYHESRCAPRALAPSVLLTFAGALYPPPVTS